MDHAERAQAELAGVAARAEILRPARWGRRFAAVAVVVEADDVFHQWRASTQFDSFYAAAFLAGYIDRKPLESDGV
jgi:hypothetical protein